MIDPKAKLIQALAAEAKKRAAEDIKLRQWALDYVKQAKNSAATNVADAAKVIEFLTVAPLIPESTETESTQ